MRSGSPVSLFVTGTCSPTQFACSSGECLHQEWLCDGWTDCADGTDEHDCDNSTYPTFSEPTIHTSYLFDSYSNNTTAKLSSRITPLWQISNLFCICIIPLPQACPVSPLRWRCVRAWATTSPPSPTSGCPLLTRERQPRCSASTWWDRTPGLSTHNHTEQ